MSDFDNLLKEIDDGQTGKNKGISTGNSKLDKYASIRKRIMTLIFSSSGVGKSAMAHQSFILEPFEQYCLNPKPVKVILFSMERPKSYILAKWLSRKIFLMEGVIIPLSAMFGWNEESLTFDQHDLIEQYRDYIDRLTEEFVTIYAGPDNPTGFRKILREFAESRGKVEQIDEHRKIYLPDKENEIIIPIWDHAGLVKLEPGNKNGAITNKKQAIDKLVEDASYCRDFYGYSPLFISQINRDLGSVLYQKKDTFEPTVDHIKETGNIGEAADVIMSIFDPIRYSTEDKHYNANAFVNPENGNKCFRKVTILKNSYGADGIGIGLGFMGEIGAFKELPKPDKNKEIDPNIYKKVLNNTYFLQKNN